MDQAPLDGNAAAGDFADLFAFDVTTAMSTCAACRQVHTVATLRAFVQSPGLVLRCASCGAVQVRVVRTTDRVWLDLRGVRVLEIPTPVHATG